MGGVFGGWGLSRVCGGRGTLLAGIYEAIVVMQLMMYYEPEQDVTPPLKLEPCVTIMGSDTVKLEPLVRCWASGVGDPSCLCRTILSSAYN